VTLFTLFPEEIMKASIIIDNPSPDGLYFSYYYEIHIVQYAKR